jgi:hypothetical protein
MDTDDWLKLILVLILILLTLLIFYKIGSTSKNEIFK